RATGLGPAGGGAGGARPQPTAWTVAAPVAPVAPLAAAVTARPTRSLVRRRLAGCRVTLVDPDLDADPAERRAGLEEAVLDVRAQRVQRDPALAVELGAAHLGAAEAARDLNPDALDHGVLHGRLHRLAHRAAEADPARQLLGHALRDELRVGLRRLHHEDVQLHLLAGELLEVAADLVRLGALTTDDDARAGGVDVDADPVAGALDVHLGHTRALETLGHQLADLHVLGDVVLVQLVGVPARLPVRGNAEPEPGRVNLLTHYSAPSSAAGAALAAFLVEAFLAGLSLSWSAFAAVAFLAG